MKENRDIRLELWADSFHEGDWACRLLATHLKTQGYETSVTFVNGFIPEYHFRKKDHALTVIVLGSYRSWNPVPREISAVLDWGKPDFMLFDPTTKKILFAVEETAAVPTGNQALQRCERMYGALRAKIPFWYLISEYGQHVDGGVRRDSIWPTIMALKLTRHTQVPYIVLHYSDLDNPEDYSCGSGVAALFSCLAGMLVNIAEGEAPLRGLQKQLSVQYADMLTFIKDQWGSIIDFLPGEQLLASEGLAQQVATCAVGEHRGAQRAFDQCLDWPKVSGVPERVREAQANRGLIKHDPLCSLFEDDLKAGRAYALSNNTGSRPQPRDSVEKWIMQQKRLFERGTRLTPKAEYTVKVSDFPESTSGLLHVTTAKNIVYLYDHWEHVQVAMERAYPRLKGRVTGFDEKRPTLVYISNSLKPGRIFGDPYTGQIAAFATIFGKIDVEPRYVLAYFPHQAYTQALLEEGEQSNKGLTLMAELTDLLLFAGGVGVALQQHRVL